MSTPKSVSKQCLEIQAFQLGSADFIPFTGQSQSILQSTPSKRDNVLLLCQTEVMVSGMGYVFVVPNKDNDRRDADRDTERLSGIMNARFVDWRSQGH